MRAMANHYRNFRVLAAIVMPIAFAAAVVWWASQQLMHNLPAAKMRVFSVKPPPSAHLDQIRVRDAVELRRLFSELDYHWPPEPGPTVPRIAIDPLPSDFAWPEDVQRRKRMFFRVLTPLVLAENTRIRHQRGLLVRTLEAIDAGELAPGDPDWLRLERLASDYQVDGELTDDAVRETLRRRVDIVPVALVLAQAANESGWGGSRFAREGNNLFGLWTYKDGEGIVPSGRPEGETYEIRRYHSLQASVRSHIYNLNIGHAYEELRELRAGMRERGEDLDAVALAAGLGRYSSRGQEYVNEIRSIIEVNGLTRLAQADLRELGQSIISLRPRYTSLTLQVAATRAD